MARMGLAHLLLYNKKMNEIDNNYTNTSENLEHFNPKDEEFFYF